MAYELIETIEVGSGGAASIEFTSIPQDGVDLVCKMSLRGGTGSSQLLQFRLNSDTGTNYSVIRLVGDGSSVGSFGGTGNTASFLGAISSSSDTASTFSNSHMYISNYTSTTNKSIGGDAVSENNATFARQDISATGYTTTSPITSILLYPINGTLEQYSTASLYKIY